MCLSLYVWNSEAGGSYTKGHVMVVAESVEQAREIIRREVWELPEYICYCYDDLHDPSLPLSPLRPVSCFDTTYSRYFPDMVAECDENAPEVYPIDQAYLVSGGGC